MRPISALLPLASVLTVACSASNPVACTEEARAGIVVEVRDADTQAAIANLARGSATELLYSDSLRVSGALTLSGVFERPGTYTVDVRATGYQPFTQAGVRVTKDACHVITQTVRATLQKVRS